MEIKTAKTAAAATKKPEVKPVAKTEQKPQTHGETCTCTETNFKPVNGTICHVEFTVPNLEVASKFYGQLFGWQFQPFMQNEWYFTTPENAGPCGCMMQGNAEIEGKTVIYVNVTDINKTIEYATKLGAKTIKPKTEIQGGWGYFATFKGPEGNTFGVYSKN